MPISELPNNIGRRRWLIGIQGDRRPFTVLDEIHYVPANNAENAIYFQKLQFGDSKEPELRLGYYMIGKKPGRAKGR
jgi:hypothetical protein